MGPTRTKLLERHAIDVDAVVGLEGPASNFGRAVDEASRENQERIRSVVESVREDPTSADLSNHILAVGVVQ